MTATLRILRHFAAPPARVYAAWTDPDRFARWIGPVGVPCDVLAMDPTEGGAYRLMMRPSEGGPIRISGTFTRLDPTDRIEFTWDARWSATPDDQPPDLSSSVCIHLRPAGEGTEMEFLHHLPDADMVHAHRDGWASAFTKLQTFLER